MVLAKRSSCISSILCLLQILAQTLASTRFNSHVSISTPALSFTHGVGDPVSVLDRKTARRPVVSRTQGNGYPRTKPVIPFNVEEVDRGSFFNGNRWQTDVHRAVTIPLLPPSPYKVDSPDPESLWPEGLFLPPLQPPRFAIGRRSDKVSEPEIYDPYLLEGSEAIAAVQRSKKHGLLYFHDIPHIQSLFANQELRAKNNLEPHVIGSIRHTWPFNRN